MMKPNVLLLVISIAVGINKPLFVNSLSPTLTDVDVVSSTSSSSENTNNNNYDQTLNINKVPLEHHIQSDQHEGHLINIQDANAQNSNNHQQEVSNGPSEKKHYQHHHIQVSHQLHQYINQQQQQQQQNGESSQLVDPMAELARGYPSNDARSNEAGVTILVPSTKHEAQDDQSASLNQAVKAFELTSLTQGRDGNKNQKLQVISENQQKPQDQHHTVNTKPMSITSDQDNFNQPQQQSKQTQQQQANEPVALQPQQPLPQQATQTNKVAPVSMQTSQPINAAPYKQRSTIVIQSPTLMQQQQPQQQTQQQPLDQQPITLTRTQQVTLPVGFPPGAAIPNSYQHHPMSPLYFGHNPFIEILRPLSYADDNIVTLNLSHSHIYEIDSDAFVGQRFEHIDLSNNKLGLIHSKSFRIGPNHSKHNPQFNPHHNTITASGASSNNNGSSSTGQKNSNQLQALTFPTRRPPPTNPKSVTIDFSHNPAIVALSGAFDHIDVPNCLLNFTNSTVELKFGAFKKYFKEHPGHIVEIDSVDCCEQEWLLGYKHNFVARTHCEHDPSLLLTKVPQQTIIDSCIAYVTSARHSMTIQGPSIIHQVAAAPRHHSSSHQDNQYLTYLILGGTAMILTSLSIYIIFYMFSLKAAFVYQMQHKS